MSLGNAVPVEYIRYEAIFLLSDVAAAALAHLGLELIIDVPPTRTKSGTRRIGLGSNGYPSIWLHAGERIGDGTHVAFKARSRKAVDEFHRAALAAGGCENGPSGIRHHYHVGY